MSFSIRASIGDRIEHLTSDVPLMGHEVLSMTDANARGRVMAWRVNQILRPLSWVIEDDADVEFVDTSSFEGAMIYRSTLAFIMTIACRKIAKSDVFVKHSISDSYYCELSDLPATPELTSAIRDEMHRIVDSAIPIQMATISLDKARRIFERQGNRDRADLVHWIGVDPITLSRCAGTYAYFGLPIAMNTGLVKVFDLEHYGDGFMLRFPQFAPDGMKLPPLQINDKVMSVFNEYSHWLKLLGVTTMASLHKKVASGEALDLILVSEAFHSSSLSKIADDIVSRGSVRLVCLAGPSSSGKTTTSRRLAIQLRALGKRPVAIELDNYYIDREKTPRDENGAYDFEALEALDLDLVNDHLVRLLAGEEVEMPKYDFISGTRKRGSKLRIGPDDILIIEGIHGLNDAISLGVPKDDKYKVFICPLTGVNLDKYNRIGTTDTRLLRRMVRDHRVRGFSPERTLHVWPSVVRGSHKHIFPYEEIADAMFNTSLSYEICVLKGYVEPMLRAIPEESREYPEARRLLSLLSFAPIIPSENVPNTSIIREFIGGSCFER